MSTILDRSGRGPARGTSGRTAGAGRTSSSGPGPGPVRPRSPLAAGALAAVQSAAASLVVVLVPVVLGWATASYSQAPWGQAVRLGVDTWLLAHHTGIAITGGHVGLAPIGLMLVPLACCWFSGVRLARALDPNAAAIRDGVGRARPAWPPRQALLTLLLGYAGLVTLAGVLVTTRGARPLVVQAFVGAVLICATGAGCGVAAWVAGGALPGLRLALGQLRLPHRLHCCLRPAAIVIAVQLLAALVAFLVALVTGWHRVLLLHHSLEPGLVGGLVLIVGQLFVLPNLVVWAGAYLAGPGFVVGTGTAVLPGRTELGALPAVPVLGALPTPGAGPPWFWAALAVPVLAGAAAGYWLLRRRAGDGALRLLQDAALSALLAGAGWLVLGWLSGGPAGPGRLASFGPSAWQLGLAITVEAGAGALLVVAAGLVGRHFRPVAREGDAGG